MGSKGAVVSIKHHASVSKNMRLALYTYNAHGVKRNSSLLLTLLKYTSFLTFSFKFLTLTFFIQVAKGNQQHDEVQMGLLYAILVESKMQTKVYIVHVGVNSSPLYFHYKQKCFCVFC